MAIEVGALRLKKAAVVNVFFLVCLPNGNMDEYGHMSVKEC